MTIHTDLPIEFDPERLRLEEPDSNALVEIYRELEFTTLLQEVERDRLAESVELRPAELIESASDWETKRAALSGDLVVAAVGPGPLGLAVAGDEGPIVYCDFRNQELRQAVVESLDRWLTDERRKITGHDLKEVLRLSTEKEELGG